MKDRKTDKEGVSTLKLTFTEIIRGIPYLYSLAGLMVFADWVALSVCREGFKDEAESFAELACRQLSKMGLVRAEGGKWVYDGLYKRS